MTTDGTRRAGKVAVFLTVLRSMAIHTADADSDANARWLRDGIRDPTIRWTA